jgi:amino acid permease
LALLGLSVTGVTGSMRILYLMVSFVAGFAFIVSPFLAINGFAANYPNLFEWTTFTAPYIATSFILAILISWPFSAIQKAEKTVDVEYQPEMDDVENIADESLTHNTEDTRDLCGKDEKL